MQALLIADDDEMRFDAITGVKQISIREGHRNFQVGGQLMLCDNVNPWAVLVDITGVRHCILEQITREEWEADGFWSPEHLLAEMQKYYPTMTYESPGHGRSVGQRPGRSRRRNPLVPGSQPTRKPDGATEQVVPSGPSICK